MLTCQLRILKQDYNSSKNRDVAGVSQSLNGYGVVLNVPKMRLTCRTALSNHVTRFTVT